VLHRLEVFKTLTTHSLKSLITALISNLFISIYAKKKKKRLHFLITFHQSGEQAENATNCTKLTTKMPLFKNCSSVGALLTFKLNVTTITAGSYRFSTPQQGNKLSRHAYDLLL